MIEFIYHRKSTYKNSWRSWISAHLRISIFDMDLREINNLFIEMRSQDIWQLTNPAEQFKLYLDIETSMFRLS